LGSFEKNKENLVPRLKHASSHYYENVRCQGERRTKNHRHSRHETYNCYNWDDAAWATYWPLYSNHVTQGGMV